MKKIMTVIMIIILFMFSGCGEIKTIQGKTYDTYGLFNESSNKNPNIEYRVIAGNVIWSIILIETIIFPIYFIGFSLFEPVYIKSGDDNLKGVIR